jgi:hypothetical protein
VSHIKEEELELRKKVKPQLVRTMENTSWNNIPLPLKEMIQALLNAHLK